MGADKNEAKHFSAQHFKLKDTSYNRELLKYKLRKNVLVNYRLQISYIL